jgi:probable HAF family extracellular repeat protein
MIRALSRSFLILASFGLIAGCSELPTGPDSSREPVEDLDWLTAPMAVVNGDYVIQDLGTLGGAWSEAYGVNDNGWVVGVSTTESGDQHAFLWTKDGGMQDISGPGWNFSRAEGLNNKGMVVGWGIKDGDGIRGFFWTAEGGMQSIGAPSLHNSSYCFNANDNGEIVGMALSRSGSWNAIVWRTPTNLTLLGSLGGSASRALDINEEGRVAGKSTLDNTLGRAVLWIPQNPMVDLGTLGGSQSEGFGINELSRIVGWAHDDLDQKRPFYWDGDLQDLGTLGGPDGEAYEITDDGLIVGDSENGSLEIRATLWTLGNGTVDLGTLGGAESHARDISGNGLIAGFALTVTGDRHAVRWAVEDGGGGASTVPELIEDLWIGISDAFTNGSFKRWRAQSLLVRVRIAERQYERNRPSQAARTLRSLIRRLQLYVRLGWMSSADAQPLIETAQEAIDLLLE